MTAPRTAILAEAGRIFALAWPVVLTSLNWTMLHLTDVAVVGLVSTEETAALGASRTLTFVAIVMGLAWLSGVLVFVSRADGAGDLPQTGASFRSGALLGLILGLAMGAVLLAFALPLLLAIGVTPDIAPRAAQVVQMMAVAYPFQFVMIAASYFLEGVSRPQRVMVVNLGMLPLNAVLAWAWSGGHLGLPMWGAVGAAAATSLVSVLGTAAMLAAVFTLPRARARSVLDRSRAAWRRAWADVPALARFGLIPAIASALELGGFAFMIALSTQLGIVTAHAFQIVFSLHNVTFALALGLGSAAGVRVGNAVGAGERDQARPRVMIAAGLAILITIAGAAMLMILARPVVSIIPAAETVHVLAAAMLLLWAPFILFDGLQVVLMYALRSLGDQVMAGINGIMGFFVVTCGVGWWLVSQGVGPMALVWAVGLGMVTAAVLNGARFWWITRPGHPQS
jgi:MATE family multidrug resistance protein